LVFFLLKKVTSVNFDPGAIIPSKDDTKNAHTRFLETFKNTSINDLKTAYDDIQTYKNTENGFALGELGQDIIKTEIDEIKTNVQEIKGQIEANRQTSVIQTLSENVMNQIFLINHKIDKLDDILTSAFNTVIFTTDAKVAINYMDNTYFEQVRATLEALHNQMQNLQNELAQPTFNYSPANLDSFLDTGFSVDLVNAQAISDEYSTFITEVSQINAAYSNLSMFGTALRNQVNGIGFENVLLEDGFCDLEENLLEAILTEAIQSQNAEWGGQYNSKKDWMHFGIDGYHYEDYLY